MKGLKLFKANRNVIEQTYNKYYQDYTKYMNERNALLIIMEKGSMGDKLPITIRNQMYSRITELNRIIDELYEALDDILIIYKHYGYKEERGRRRKG